MDFELSTQAKHWMFNEASLVECRQRAAVVQSTRNSKPRVLKFASGYGQQSNNKVDSIETCPLQQTDPHAEPNLPSDDQEILVHFHAHQIQRLIGPNAIFSGLQRSASSLSTAIMIFRRFYLSNSVIDFHPRNIAAASALLAVKVDCENKLEIALLAHATSVVQRKARKAPLCRDELRAVSIEEIEAAERALLEGLNYQLRCHHPFGAIRVLASDVTTFLACRREGDVKLSRRSSQQYGYRSPQTVDECYSEERTTSLCERAIAIAQSALVYSDVNLLFPPGQIAFACVSIALEGNDYGGRLGAAMRSYLRMRFPHKTEEELCQFEFDVSSIICNLASCQAIDLHKFCSGSYTGRRHSAQNRAAEVSRVFGVAAGIRMRRKIVISSKPVQVKCVRKRVLDDDRFFCRQDSFKIARVTPNQNSVLLEEPSPDFQFEFQR